MGYTRLLRLVLRIFSVGRILNLAYGAYLMLGGYMYFWISQSMGMPKLFGFNGGGQDCPGDIEISIDRKNTSRIMSRWKSTLILSLFFRRVSS